MHAKVCIVDDTWTIIGSDNFNRRSWTHDSEVSCAILDEDGSFARRLRLALGAEHLGEASEAAGSAAAMFEAFGRAADALDAWHAGGRQGPRPAGQLRRYPDPRIPAATRAWASILYRLVYDPDGRPAAMRRASKF